MVLIRNFARAARGALRPSAGVYSARPFSWDALGRKAEADAETKADFNALKNYFDGIEKDYNTWSKPVQPINWDHYKSVIETPGFVDFLKSRYEGIDWSSINTKLADAEVAADKQQRDAMMRDGEALVAAAEALIAETKAKLELATNMRTDRDSTVEEVWAKNPKIKEEVLKEIEEHAWFKDVK